MEPTSTNTAGDWEQKIKQAMRADRYKLRQQRKRIDEARQAGKPSDRNDAKWVEELERSIAWRDQRKAELPKPTYDLELPISERRTDIAQAIARHQVVVVCGETGSGKSTQLPKICLELGRGVDGLIGHTQPRRIAARSIAARVAEELKTPLGKEVGFKIRFTDATSPKTYVKLMTDGILLAETAHDRFLDQYDTLIIDEAHERSLNIDFLLGFLHRLLPRRRDLRVIVTSATIDAQRMADYFAPAVGETPPVIVVEGRTYPVEVRYRPLVGDAKDEEGDWLDGVSEAIDELGRLERGHTLLFVPTERDIREAAKMLRGHPLVGQTSANRTEILPLYGRLSTAEQNRVFQPSSQRRIVVATNVAESSLTVPGIRYVIDVGTARIARYSTKSKVQRLPVEPISQASADQRKGRCGRVGPGICFRLYSEEDYNARDRFTPPEIQRTNLASVILQTKYLKLGPIEEFPFPDPPRPSSISDGYKTLFELGAIDDGRELTEMGRQLARLPVDPRIARIILAGHAENCLHEILIIASALELQDPRERPAEKQGSADEAHAQFQHPESDFLSYLKLWDFFRKLEKDLSHSKLRKACQQNFLSYNRLREWVDVHRQLLQLTDEAEVKQHGRKDEYGPIHKALLTGLLSNVALRGEGSEYTGAGGQKFYLWPGSGLIAQKPKWVVASELVETSRRYMRCSAKIDPDWIEPLAGHLVNRSYSDPRWDVKRSTVSANEKVSLFGLPLVAARKVNYGPIDPKKAREIFIQQALVEAQMDPAPDFLQYNQELLAECETLQAKARRGDLMLPAQSRYEFYDEHLPGDVYDGQQLQRWRGKLKKEDDRKLFMNRSDVMLDPSDLLRPGDFPDVLDMHRMKLRLDYHLEPGTDDDGVTINVPREGLNQLHPARLGWLVPGLLEEKVTAVIKSLPKNLRRLFVPAPDTAKKVLAEIQYGQGDFNEQVAALLTRIAGQSISPMEFDPEKIPRHLRMNVRVLDADGNTLAAGRDLQVIRQELGEEAAAAFTALADDRWTKDGLTSWDFGELPAEVPFSRGGVSLTGYPAVVDQGDAVGLRLLDSPDLAQSATRAGVRRLFLSGVKRDLKQQIDWLPKLNQLLLQSTAVGGAQNFKQQLTELIADRALFPTDDLPRSQDAFDLLCRSARKRLPAAVQEISLWIVPCMQGIHDARVAVDRLKSPQTAYAVEDLRSQFTHLAASDFLTAVPWAWLRHYPRYLQAFCVRLEKLASGGPLLDKKSHDLIAPRWKKYLDRKAQHDSRRMFDPGLAHYRWLLEEFRVSLFAQKLGTSVTVSDKRLDKQWAETKP